MTIHNIASQLHDLSVAGYFNGEKFSKAELEHYIRNMFRTGSTLVMEIALPDGRWFFKIERYANEADGYDYSIPDTREEEDKIFALLAQQ